MKPSSAKQKGRLLQQWVRDKLIEHFVTYGKQLQEGDFESTSMGAQGVDVKLSPSAKVLFPYKIECKSMKSIAVYNYYDQAVGHKEGGKHPEQLKPLVFIKMNGRKPLAIVDAEHFIGLHPCY